MEDYDFNNEKRGIALLIHNEEFDRYSGYKDRPGDNGDYLRMKEIFGELGFQVIPHRNLTAIQIWTEVQRVANASDIHQKSDCFACVIASHGEEMALGKENNVKIKEHVIIGTDGKGVKTRDLVEMFDEGHCEALENKPKFFFIQACRTSKDTVLGMDKGHTVTITSSKEQEIERPLDLDNVDSNTIGSHTIEKVADLKITDDLDTKHVSSAEFPIPERQDAYNVTDVECPEDSLLMFASLSHNYAVRNATDGGWLLTSLYSKVKQYLENGSLWNTDFTQILNDTLKVMTTKNFKPSDIYSPLYGAFSPGCFTHCLTKQVLFTKRH